MVALMLVLQLLGGMVLSPQRTFFPLYAQELGYSAAIISALTTAQLAISMAASLGGGLLSDRVGCRVTLLLGHLCFGAASLLFWGRAGWGIALLWMVGGAGIGLRTVSSQSYLLDSAPPAYLGLLTALYNWGLTLGGALGSPILGLVLERSGYGFFGGALAGLALLAAAINAFFLPSPAVPSRRAAAGQRQMLSGYREIALRPAVILLVLLRFLPTLYWGVALVFIPLLLDAAGADKMAIAGYAAASQVAAALVQVVAGRAADRYGVRWPALIAYIGVSAGALATGLLARPAGALATASVLAYRWGIICAGVVGASAAWSLSTLLVSLVTRAAGVEERGRVLGWVHLWWSVAMIIGTALGGALFERSMGLPFTLTGLINLLSIPVVVIFLRLTHRLVAAAATE